MSDVTAVMDLGVEEPQLSLPPGFRFHPTDEEVVTYYLTPKVRNPAFSCPVVADVDLNKNEPWDLPRLAKMGEKEWFFFVHKDRKYPTGTRTNRATEKGYWKATGKDKEIFRGKGPDAVLVGMKKTLVFYRGRAPSGKKTPWVMHEYRLEGALPHRILRSAKDDWAVCRVFDKDLAAKNAPPQMAPAANVGMEEDPYAFLDELLNNADLPPMLMDSPSGADDFAGASSSASASSAALPLDPDMVDLIIKAELPVPQQQMQSPNYFIMPATANGNLGGAGCSSYQYQAMGDQQPAIRRHCKPKADAASTSALLSSSLGFNAGTLAGAADTPFLMPPSRLSYLDLEELCPGEPLMDFTNMWNN